LPPSSATRTSCLFNEAVFCRFAFAFAPRGRPQDGWGCPISFCVTAAACGVRGAARRDAEIHRKSDLPAVSVCPTPSSPGNSPIAKRPEWTMAGIDRFLPGNLVNVRRQHRRRGNRGGRATASGVFPQHRYPGPAALEARPLLIWAGAGRASCSWTIGGKTCRSSASMPPPRGISATICAGALRSEPSIDWIDCQSRQGCDELSNPFDPIAGPRIDVGGLLKRNPTIVAGPVSATIIKAGEL